MHNTLYNKRSWKGWLVMIGIIVLAVVMCSACSKGKRPSYYYDSSEGLSFDTARIDVPEDKRSQAKAALTELFESIRSEETPIIVEQVVNDIDNEVVNIIRQFNDAFQSVTARREIKKKLRSILWIKYQIKDNDVFEKAYQYIEMYY